MPNWKKLIVSGSDANLNSLTVNGNITSPSDLTLDAGGDIIFDADGTDIILKDGGTSFGSFKRASSDFVIKSEASNNDIILKGVDSGVTITALTLDMSAEGKALFNNDVVAFSSSDKRFKDNINRPLAAILTLNTFAHTLGAAGVGAKTLEIYGESSVAIASGILTLLILIFSEKIKVIDCTFDVNSSLKERIERIKEECEISVREGSSALILSDKDISDKKTEIPIGVSCRTCDRLDCSQRAFPPLHKKFDVDINSRGVSVYVGDKN